MYGTYVSGDKDYDKDMQNAFTNTYLPISEIVDLHRKGATVRLVNSEDIKTIYTYITNHLRAWVELSSYGLNVNGGPFEDLRAMEVFASEIYDTAKHYFKVSVPDSDLHRRLQGLLGIETKDFVMKVNTTNVTHIDNGAEDVPIFEERESFADHLSKKLSGYKSWDKQ